LHVNLVREELQAWSGKVREFNSSWRVGTLLRENKLAIQQKSRTVRRGWNCETSHRICSPETGLLAKFAMELHGTTVRHQQFGGIGPCVAPLNSDHTK